MSGTSHFGNYAKRPGTSPRHSYLILNLDDGILPIRFYATLLRRLRQISQN